MKSTIIRQCSNAIEIQTGDLIQRLIPVTDHIVRCIASRKEIIQDMPSLLIEPGIRDKSDHPVSCSVSEDDAYAYLTLRGLRAAIDKNTGYITWQKNDGKTLLQEKGKELSEIDVIVYTTGDEKPVIKRVRTVDGERNFIQNLKGVVDRKAYRAKLYFTFQDGEGIHGLGQAEEGIYDYHGHNQYLYQHNMRIPMPVITSTNGYGILLDCCSLMTFSAENDPSYIHLDTVDQLDYYFIAGNCIDEIIAGYRMLTGQAQMLPRWAYGYVQSKEQYYTAKELVDIVRHYRDINVPLDCVVQDWNTWEDGQWGNKITDKTRYGDLKACMQQLHQLHAHSMVSVWPNMNSGCDNYEELMAQDCMLGDLATYNAFSEKARKIYWKQCKEELFDGGFDSWWCDSTEPFSGPDWGGEICKEPWERYALVGNEHKKYIDPAKANAFSLVHAQGIYENQRADNDEKRVLNLTRSGYPGIQKYGAMLWSGDTCAKWETLRTQITEGLNMGLSGYPYWTLDIGAFFTVNDKWQNRGCRCNTDPTPKWFWQGDYNEGVNDPGYKELYTRWLQMGTFLPMFRSHGTDTPREIWNFGKSGDMFYDAIEKFIKLRYELMPYIYSLAAQVHFHSGTIMRSLLFDFPEDNTAKIISQEFMFGPSLLICPVTSPMYYEAEGRTLESIDQPKKWRCYLPAGCGWYDYWTNTYYEGGQYIDADAGIDKIPVFVKAGSILPTAAGLMWADQVPADGIKIKVYRKTDGSFTLYEDEGNSYRFEQGEYAATKLTWDEQKQAFEIGERIGSYTGMIEPRFSVELI